MKYGKIGAGCLAVVLCLGTMPVTAWAGTPEFAYTAEQWASLRDNQLEFTEIADLIHVYNNTVIQNQLEYEDFRGEDADVKKLEYDKTEAGLVKEAQELMISYWSQTYSLESLEQNKIQAQSSYDQTLNRLSAGMSTQAQVLSAREAVTSADASLLSAQSSLGQTKETLCLMLGWTYGAQVDIGDVPEPDLEGMTAINLEEDVSASSIKNAYESMMISKSDYEQALNAYEIEAAAMETAERKMAAGTMTRNDYVTQQTAFAAAQVNVRTQKLALLKAQLEYRWSVDGLASVS